MEPKPAEQYPSGSECQPTSPTVPKAEHSWPGRQTLQDQAFWVNFVLLLDECSCCQIARPQPSEFAGNGVCRFGKERQETSPGISQRLLQWEKRTGNAPPISFFLRRGSVIALSLRVQGRSSLLPSFGLAEQAVRLGRSAAGCIVPASPDRLGDRDTPPRGQGGAVPAADHRDGD